MEPNPPSSSRRQWLALGAASIAMPLFVRRVRADDQVRFALGVASGQPRASSVVLWTRLTGTALPANAEVRWEIAHDERFSAIAAQGVETARVEDAHSVHAEPGGLEPGRSYWYRFEALGQRSAVGRTRTAPAPHDRVRLRLALTSCQRWDHGHYAAWRHIADADFDLVLFVGDYIYEYASNPSMPRQHEGGLVRTLAQYRARYAQYKSDPALQAAHAACPWLVVWDDHEVDNDYASLHSLGDRPDFVLQRAAAYQAYWEHMPFPKAARPQGADMRIYDHYDWGALARIHLLDDRQYRDVQVCPRLLPLGANTVAPSACPTLLDPQRTLLGAAQERWLAEGWDLQRPWNLLAQQTLMARFSWRDASDPMLWTDGWDGYGPARDRLLGVVEERKVPGVVVFGGDVHAHYVADLKRDFNDPRAAVLATEFCGTSISSNGQPQPRISAALRHNPHIRYGRSDQRGYVACSLDEQRLEARLMVVGRPLDPASDVDVAARFVVDAKQAGAHVG